MEIKAAFSNIIVRIKKLETWNLILTEVFEIAYNWKIVGNSIDTFPKYYETSAFIKMKCENVIS